MIAVERLEGAALLPLLLDYRRRRLLGLGNMAEQKAGRRIDMLGLRRSGRRWCRRSPCCLASLLFDGPRAIRWRLLAASPGAG